MQSEADQRQRLEGELQQHREQLGHAQQQAEDLRVANEQLHHELTNRQQVEEQLQQRTHELDEARQQLQSEIDQRQRLEGELQQHREVATKGIAVVDLGGTVHYVNQGWVEMHGYSSKAELIGKPISAFHTSEQWESEVTPFIEEAKHRGQLCGPIEHIRNDGGTLPTETTMIRLGSEEGGSIGFIVFAKDGREHSHPNQQVQREAVESVTANESI